MTGRPFTNHQAPEADPFEMLGHALEDVGMAVFLIDSEARFHYANGQACRSLGYSRTELLGLSVADVDPHYSHQRWPQHWDELRQRRSLLFESSHRRRDGTEFPVEINASYFEYQGRAYNLALAHDIGERRRTEQALREHEQQFRTLAETTPNVLVRYDRDCRQVYVNPAYERETGVPRHQALGVMADPHLSGALPPEQFRATLSQVMETGSATQVLLEWPRPDGSTASHDFHIVAERDPEQKVIGALAMGHDVSALKRQERLELMRLHFFERLVQDGELEEVLGLVNRYVEESRPGFRCSIMVVTADGGHLHAIPTPSLAADYLAAVDGIRIGDGFGSCGTAAWRGEPVIVDDVLEHPYWAPYRDLARRADFRACWSEPIKNSSGRVLGTFGIYQRHPARPTEEDRELLRQASFLAAIAIERRSAEKNLMRYASIVQSSDDAIIGIDLEGHITSWNNGAEQLFGYRAEEALGQPVTLLIPAERQPEETTILEQIRQGKTVKHFETARLRKDGQAIDISVTVSPLRDIRGRVVGASKIARDISERKASERELRRYRAHLEELVAERTRELELANRELEAFTYSASHDLRTPLRAIDGFSRMLASRCENQLDSEGQRLLKVVRNNAARMSQLIDGILAFSRCGRLQIKSGEVDMKRLAEAAWMDLSPLREGRDIRLQLSPLNPAKGDPLLLRQVWSHLLTNAIKFTATRPEAHIEVGSVSATVETCYFVKDNGVGFDPSYAHKLFGVFQRLHAVEEFAGTGIGLAIVKRIVARHGGRVEAEGRPGEGATFRFSLPTAEANRANHGPD
ncbi:MAG: PAS domain S-box protein [Methylococcaceae bacterium]|nr:PAS domain S-box protein [Methylococcaceae bacterium]